jgi:hypothetical protein
VWLQWRRSDDSHVCNPVRSVRHPVCLCVAAGRLARLLDVTCFMTCDMEHARSRNMLVLRRHSARENDQGACARIGAQGLGQVEPALTALAKARRAAMTIIQTADRAVVIDACNDLVGRTLQTVVGNISFKDVVFAYPSRPEQNVSCLSCLSARVQPNALLKKYEYMDTKYSCFLLPRKSFLSWMPSVNFHLTERFHPMRHHRYAMATTWRSRRARLLPWWGRVVAARVPLSSLSNASTIPLREW